MKFIAGERMMPGDLVAISENDGKVYRAHWEKKKEIPFYQVETIIEKNEEFSINIKIIEEEKTND